MTDFHHEARRAPTRKSARGENDQAQQERPKGPEADTSVELV